MRNPRRVGLFLTGIVLIAISFIGYWFLDLRAHGYYARGIGGLAAIGIIVLWRGITGKGERQV